jgi:hypothetical protein
VYFRPAYNTGLAIRAKIVLAVCSSLLIIFDLGPTLWCVLLRPDRQAGNRYTQAGLTILKDI